MQFKGFRVVLTARGIGVDDTLDVFYILRASRERDSRWGGQVAFPGACERARYTASRCNIASSLEQVVAGTAHTKKCSKSRS